MKAIILTLFILSINSCSYFEKDENKDGSTRTISVPTDSLKKKELSIDSLNVLLNNIFPEDLTNENEENNEIIRIDSSKVAEQIIEILNRGFNIIDQATISRDKNLIIFSDEQETGGSMSTVNHIIAYKTKNKGYKLLTSFAEDETNIRHLSPAWLENIYELPSKQTKLYLVIGGGKGNNAFNYSLATVIELKNDTLNFNYPAFEYRDTSSFGTFLNSKSSFTIDYLNSNEETESVVFDYDTVKNQIYFKYKELTVSEDENVKEKTISKKLKFNGYKFNGFVY